MAFTVTLDPLYTGGGKWFDFVTEEGGNFLGLARRLGILTDGPAVPAAPIPTTKRAYADLTDYARAHGVDATVFLAAHWRLGQWPDPISGQRRPALLFETTNGTRARFIDGLPKPHPTYINQRGFSRCWYGLADALALPGPLVFCNGEASTVVAQAHDVPALTVAGGGEKRLPDDLLDELIARVPPGSRELLIALDADSAGRRATRQIAAQLHEAGYTARAVAFDGHPGFDLADFCRLHGADTLAALQALPDLPPEAQALPPEPQTEVAATQQTIIQQLQKALEEMRSRLHWLTDLLARKDLKTGARAAIRSIVLEMERVPVEEQTDGRLYEVRAWKIAEENGITSGTVTRALDRLNELGYIEKQKTTAYDPEEQKTRSTIYVRPLVNLRALEEVPPVPKEHRPPAPRCGTCGSPRLSTFAYVCEHGHLTTAEAARPVDEEACLQNAITVEAEAPPEVAEPCLQNAITPPIGELRPESAADPFFAERACSEPALSHEDLSTLPLTSNDPPVQNATTPPDGMAGLVARLRQLAQQRGSPPARGAVT